ncbi:MAG: PAS domain S-box protein, partial [Acidobacteriota bacterium]
MVEKTFNILIVDNNVAAAEETRTLLQKEEPCLKLDLACKGQEGLRKAEGGGYDLIVSEYHLTPTMNGLQFLDALRASGIEVPFIIYSSEKSLERIVDCLRRGAEDYLFKEKQNIRELASSIAKAAERFHSQRGYHKLLQQIQEEKNYLENIIVNSIDAVVVADREGKVTLWNKGAQHLFGYTAEEVMGKHIDQFIVPPKFRRTEEKLLKLVEKKGGSFLEKEVKRVRKSGEVIYTTASYNLVRDTNGKIVGLSAIEKDITEQKRLDRELTKAKEKYRLQYQREQRKSAILNTITKVSRKITAILDLEKLLQKVINIILALGYYHVSIWTTQPENKQVVYKTGDPESIRIRKGTSQRFKEGIIGCVGCTGKPILANDVSKEPRYLDVYRKTKSELSVPIRFGPRILGVLDVQSINLNAFTREDLSALQILADQIAVAMENARLYEDARSKGDYLQSLVRNVTDAIVSIDSQGKVVEWNKGARKLFGYTRDEILGKELDAIIVPKDKKEEAVSITKRAMAGRETIDFETSRRRKDGTLSNVLLSASPIIKGKKF